MRRMLVVGSAVGLLVFSSACATTTGGNGTSSFSATPSIKRLSRQEQVAWRDSVYAQAVADVEGPGATIRAEFSSLAGSRRVRARFSLDADAYVVIGHIDASGVLRIAFPTNPATDDGFVSGHKTYQTHEFFSGFTDEYRFRAATSRPVTRNYDSYDGGLGFMFIIASWRPMHLDRFRDGDRWDSFELTDDSYLRDPRPAIYELATLLVGESREAYTVKFARYTNTTNMYAMSPFGGNAFGSFSYCNGYRPLGFGYDPLADGFMDAMFMGNSYAMQYGGMSFTRRGVFYQYDSFMGCYRANRSAGYITPGYRIANGPTNPGNGGGTVKRPFNPEDLRVPFNPRPIHPSTAPGGRVVEGNARGDLPTASPTYRQRGLITTDDQGLPGRREPRVAAHESQARSRPSIQDMVGRRPAANENTSRAGTGYTRSSGSTYGSSSSFDRPQARDRSGSGSSSSGFDGGSRMSGSGSSGGGSVGATSGGTGGSSAAASPPASSTGTGATGSTSSGRPPL
jgi:hypothetical protein